MDNFSKRVYKKILFHGKKFNWYSRAFINIFKLQHGSLLLVLLQTPDVAKLSWYHHHFFSRDMGICHTIMNIRTIMNIMNIMNVYNIMNIMNVHTIMNVHNIHTSV